MKKLAPRAWLLAFALAGSAPTFTHAATQTWNPGGAGGGNGVWSGNNWDSASAWVNGNTAIFGSNAGTVTVGTQTASGITFNLTGYNLISGTLNFAPAITGGAVVFTTAGAGQVSSIANSVGFTGITNQAFTKTGSGILNLSTSNSGTNTIATPVWTITGGTFSPTAGLFDSIIQLGGAFGRLSGSGGKVILDAGTLEVNVEPVSSTFTGSSLVGTSRALQVNTGGGAFMDASTGTAAVPASNNSIDCPITDNAGATSSFYLSNGAGITTKFTGLISGTGGVTWNGGTGVFSGANTYMGSTVIQRGTFQLAAAPGYNSTMVASGSWGSNAVALASGATLSLQGAVLKFDLSNSADKLNFPVGNVTVGGINNIRIATNDSSLAPGTYSLLTAGANNLTGSFQMDGGSTLTVPATSMIKQVGGTFYRLTLQISSSAEQVVVSPASGVVINEMPLGSSITEGASAQGATYAGGGYRSQLYQLLVHDGRFIPNFVGSATLLDNNAAAGYNVLTGANQLHHEGHGGFTTANILGNLRTGGNWLAPGNGVNPDYVTLSIGGNDYGNNSAETVNPLLRTDAIISSIATLRPAAQVIAANLFYRTQTATANGTTVIVGDLQNTYYNPGVPAMVYNHTLAGHHVSFVDQYTAVTPNNNVTNIGSDGIHPVTPGYNVMANTWYNALAFGSAYWTGSQGNQWSTVTAGNLTNFAVGYEMTVPRQTALDAGTDVHFNGNTSALPTTLGADLSVRGVNFMAGAIGPVTVGGSNTLTLNAGGITVQPGTGAHTITANITLGAKQTWGNVSSNVFTVSGVVSGNYALTTTGSYTVQLQVGNGSGTTPQTYTGTGAIVLTGANTYSGATTVSSGTLIVSNSSGSGTGTSPVSVASAGTLTNNGGIGGDLSLGGKANGSGTFGGTVTVTAGGVFSATGTINGVLGVGSGGLVALPGGTLTVNGGVVNNGTVRLAHGATLAVGNGGTFTNNGVLDIITGNFIAQAGFVNNGVVLDSSVVRAKSVNMSGGVLTVAVDGYTGHTYQFQRSPTLNLGDFTNLGPAQTGTTGSALIFTDGGLSGTQGFYRVQVDP